MARLDLYRNPQGRGYLLDVQSDLLEGLNTRVVVPLMPRGKAPAPAHGLNPVFSVDGAEVIMATQFLAAVPLAELKTPIGRLDDAAHQVATALDRLFIGF